ncbi:MAG: acyloxyacyl hydrolase [Flavobacteriaceae bacterium]|nr:acyloxyacyl hydrolase [Flavobacteriaceae bacterium]
MNINGNIKKLYNNKLALLLILTASDCHSQETTSQSRYYIQVDQVISHTKRISLSINKDYDSVKPWHRLYKYPYYGITFIYNNYKYNYMGESYSVLFNYNFHLIKTNKTNSSLILTPAIGLAYNTKTYNPINNPENIYFGTSIAYNLYMKLIYKIENIFNNIGLHTGIGFYHISNGSIKRPNNGFDNSDISIGLSYNYQKNKTIKNSIKQLKPFTKHMRHYIASEISLYQKGTDQAIFFSSIFSYYINYKYNRVSGLQLGAELFVSSVIQGNESSFKRLGLFTGYELQIGNVSISPQIGYYAYKPNYFNKTTYHRLKLKYNISEKWSLTISLKTHLLNAESMSYGLNYKL